MNKPALLTALAASVLLLAACGGGGGGGSAVPGPPPSTRFGPSSQFEESVAGCDLDTQKHFVRSYLDEVYYWYGEIPDVDATAYAGIPSYFGALLVRTPDVNGLPKDRFSAVLPASQVQYVPQQAVPGATSVQQAGASYVPLAFSDTTAGGRRFGYIQFNDHAIGAEDELIAAFQQVQGAGVQDLVLDLRFNSGGYLYIAQAAASMVTGPGNTGRVFESLNYNDKRTAETALSTFSFIDSVQYAEALYAAGTPLPQLGLPRVFILSSGRTCSASESIINSLRGIDVQVIRIGDTTCGKPYGFRQKNNCGWAYFPIEFKGTNAKGYGDYTTGFTPSCQVQDNTAVTAGSATDPLLVAAKYYLDNGACPAGTATGVQSAATPMVASARPTRAPWAGRLLLDQP